MKYHAEWDKVIGLLNSKKQILLFCHDYLDGDALYSIISFTLAMEKYQIASKWAYFGKIQDELKLVNRNIILKDNIYQPSNPIDLLVVLDTGDTEQLGRGENLFSSLRSTGISVINIDHHATNDFFGDINIVNPEAAATCELLYYLLHENVHFSPDLAHGLLAGIYEDTLLLKTANVTSRTMRAVADLMDLGADRVQLIEEIPSIPNISAAQIWGKLLSSIKVSGANGNVVYTVVDLETYMSTGHKDLHRLSSLLRDIDGVDVAIVFTQRGTEEIQVSFRSKSSVDVSAVAELFGGGGHKNASGCTIYGKSLDDAVSIVLDKVEIAIKS